MRPCLITKARKCTEFLTPVSEKVDTRTNDLSAPSTSSPRLKELEYNTSCDYTIPMSRALALSLGNA